MSKSAAIKINIPDPCAQSWEDMTASGNGRYCAHCQKTVIDFTTYSDAAIYNFFAKNKKQVCGRFMNTQIDTPLRIPHQPNSRLYKLTVAFSLTVLFTQTPALLAQTRPPIAAQAIPTKNNDSTQLNSLGTGEISGKVFDEKNEPLPSAVIQVFQNGTLKGGTATDYNGSYSINDLLPGSYDLIGLYNGYDSIKKSVCVQLNNKTILNLAFKMHRIYFTGSIITREYRNPLIDIDNPGKHTFTRDEINNFPMR